jgi:hypothetical protein
MAAAGTALSCIGIWKLVERNPQWSLRDRDLTLRAEDLRYKSTDDAAINQLN